MKKGGKIKNKHPGEYDLIYSLEHYFFAVPESIFFFDSRVGGSKDWRMRCLDGRNLRALDQVCISLFKFQRELEHELNIERAHLSPGFDKMVGQVVNAMTRSRKIIEKRYVDYHNALTTGIINCKSYPIMAKRAPLNFDKKEFEPEIGYNYLLDYSSLDKLDKGFNEGER